MPYQDDSYLQDLRKQSDVARRQRHRASEIRTHGDVDPERLAEREKRFQLEMMSHFANKEGGLMELPPSVQKEYKGLLEQYMYERFLKERGQE